MNRNAKREKQKQRQLDNRTLSKAYDFVMEQWFPVNQNSLKEVEKKLQNKNYPLEELIIDLRQDSALFTYCLKELVAQREEEQDRTISDPVMLFKAAGVDKLRAIIDNCSNLRTYSKSNLDEETRLRVEETEISSETTLVIAEELNLDAGLGQSICFFRQLGLSLIAWNYPEKYGKALDRVRQDGFSLDDALTVELGFSARLLGQYIIDDWGMSNDIIQSLKSSPHHLDMNQMGSFAEVITRVCEIGETVAQVKNEEFYPKAEKAWNKAEHDLKKQFGEEGKQSLEKKLNERIDEVKGVDKKPRRVPTVTVEKPVIFAADELFHQNRYLKECPDHIQKQLTEIYKNIDPGKMCLGEAKALCNDVIPAIGFNNGCLYVFEPEVLKLVPRFRVGDLQLSHFETVHCQHDLSTSSVARAFQGGFPSVGQTDEGQRYIVGTVGRSKKAGVLYLELTDKLDEYSESDLLVFYKALIQTLADCLNV